MGADDIHLVGRGGIADTQTHHETVELRIGKRLRARRPNGILRRDTDKRPGDLVGNPVDRNRKFFHNLEQCRLGLGAGTVDFVTQQQIAIDRPHREAQSGGFLIVHGKAHDVGRHGIGGELNTFEIEVEHFRNPDGERGFTDTGIVFEQHMTSGVDGHDHLFDDLTLTYQYLADFLYDIL